MSAVIKPLAFKSASRALNLVTTSSAVVAAVMLLRAELSTMEFSNLVLKAYNGFKLTKLPLTLYTAPAVF